MSVLIVDDEDSVRESLEELLRDDGYDVDTAKNGAEALAKLGQHLPCVVILDLIMPVVDGNEVYLRMKADPRWEPIPVIVSTSDPARAPAGSLVLKKPFDVRRLLDLVKQYCAAPA